MELEPRLRTIDVAAGVYRYDIVLIVEKEAESRFIDLAFGSKVGEDGLIFERNGVAVRLADGYGEHYIALTGREFVKQGAFLDEVQAKSCECGQPVAPGEALCTACLVEDARLQAVADNTDVYEEQARASTLHRDVGPCGREVCPRHGVEVDAFGACAVCDGGG